MMQIAADRIAAGLFLYRFAGQPSFPASNVPNGRKARYQLDRVQRGGSMQIKKNPRDEGYPEGNEYEEAQSTRTPAYDVSADTVSRSRNREAGDAAAEPVAPRA